MRLEISYLNIHHLLKLKKEKNTLFENFYSSLKVARSENYMVYIHDRWVRDIVNVTHSTLILYGEVVHEYCVKCISPRKYDFCRELFLLKFFGNGNYMVYIHDTWARNIVNVTHCTLSL